MFLVYFWIQLSEMQILIYSVFYLKHNQDLQITFYVMFKLSSQNIVSSIVE